MYSVQYTEQSNLYAVKKHTQKKQGVQCTLSTTNSTLHITDFTQYRVYNTVAEVGAPGSCLPCYVPHIEDTEYIDTQDKGENIDYEDNGKNIDTEDNGDNIDNEDWYTLHL